MNPQSISHVERGWVTTDGYRLFVLHWPGAEPVRGRVVMLHGVQSHSGWYENLGRTLAAAGYDTFFPDRRGSGRNTVDRGHTPSAGRLILDVAEGLDALKRQRPNWPIALGAISWGGKLAVLTAAKHPKLVDALALICPGLHPRVGVTTGERLRIAAAMLTHRHKRFPIPLSDPALFTANPDAQRFIADDPLSLRQGTAMLLASSFFIDQRLRRLPPQEHPPTLLMLAGQDRIVDNARTLQYVTRTYPGSLLQVIEYPDGHHTLEFDADPSRYARDLISWLNQTLNVGDR